MPLSLAIQSSKPPSFLLISKGARSILISSKNSFKKLFKSFFLLQVQDPGSNPTVCNLSFFFLARPRFKPHCLQLTVFFFCPSQALSTSHFLFHKPLYIYIYYCLAWIWPFQKGNIFPTTSHLVLLGYTLQAPFLCWNFAGYYSMISLVYYSHIHCPLTAFMITAGSWNPRCPAATSRKYNTLS